MKKLKIKRQLTFTTAILIFISVVFLSFSFREKSSMPKVLKDMKCVTYIPQGTIEGKTAESFYMFTMEVSNIDYLEFLYWLNKNGKTKELEIAAIDTTLWNSIAVDGNTLYCKRYHKMNDYPVVNISKDAAKLYCKWLSNIWNNQQEEYIINFRLPTKQEWEYAASSGKFDNNNPYPWSGIYTRDYRGCYLAQHKAFGLSYGPAKTGSFTANDFGLYDMSGNVSEMIEESNIAKGGSWNSTEEELKIKVDGNIEKSPFVGFRPVMTFVKR